MQRLFSNFADGWPGVGLLLLRALTGTAILKFGSDAIHLETSAPSIVLPLVRVLSGILLLIGLFTPVTGTIAALLETSVAISQFSSHSGNPWIFLAQAVLGAALAMIGPGILSIDAYLFGRKHIRVPDR